MARQKARNLKNALDHATMYTTARACGILVHVYQYLATPLASKIRLVLLVVNSVRSHLTELKELSITIIIFYNIITRHFSVSCIVSSMKCFISFSI